MAPGKEIADWLMIFDDVAGITSRSLLYTEPGKLSDWFANQYLILPNRLFSQLTNVIHLSVSLNRDWGTHLCIC